MRRTDEPTPVERAKERSRDLRGTIARRLADDAPSFEKDDVQLLKFHGIYQQDDRDRRRARRAAGRERAYAFMVRVRLAGGRLDATQYLALDRLAASLEGDRGLRFTSRQGIQLHGVTMGELGPALRSVDRALLTTFGACGDVARNVLVSPVPRGDRVERTLVALGKRLSEELLPRTRAYHEIWIDGTRVPDAVLDGDEAAAAETVETLYGPRYLPRKFKIAVARPDDAGVDLFSQDVGLLAIVEGDEVRGFALFVGGGLGMTHGREDTFARLATPLGSIRVEDAVRVVRAVGETFRDHGNRSDRKHARLKYLIEERGIAWMRAQIERRSALRLGPRVEVPLALRPALGRIAVGEGRERAYGMLVPNGRVADGKGARIRTALRRIARELEPGVVVTPAQNAILTGLDDAGCDRVERILSEEGLGRAAPAVRRLAIACPALPTCGLALAEAERSFDTLLSALDARLAALGIDAGEIAVRMTGCPNGCARPYTADLGIVGRGPDCYDVYAGGRALGDRLAELYATDLALAQIVPALGPLLEAWSREREPGEVLGDWFARTRAAHPARRRLTGDKSSPGIGRLTVSDPVG